MAAIVVTGACRTGTSLAMQTLRLLGVPVAGLEYHVEFPDDGFHPHGAWDLPNAETLNGIRGHDYDGKAIKLFGLQLSRSEPESIGRVIVCRRNRPDALASAERMCSARNADPMDYGEAYDRNYVCIGCYLGLYPIPVMDLQFELMLGCPEIQMERIVAFLELALIDAQMDGALGNVLVKQEA
jgi:hypothetical protein